MINLRIYNNSNSEILDTELAKSGLSDVAQRSFSVVEAKSGDFPFRSIFAEEIPTLATSSKNIVIVGIGGSDLGTRAIFDALLHPFNNEVNDKKFYFGGDTTDPDQISAMFETLKLDDSLFIFVSKSGKTIEQNVFLKITIDNFAKSGIDYSERIIFITDKTEGQFRQISDENNFQSFEIPSEVRGRFSVLTNVGLIPSAIFGIDTHNLIEGARDLDEYFFKSEKDFVSQYVNFKLAEYKNGKNISVMMPYKYSLKQFAKWYQQLWAESLGKNSMGQTPVAMLGPVDQHSQLQLMNDGSDDKFVTIIKVLESKNNLVTENFNSIAELDYLSGKGLNEILNIEAEATIESLVKAGRPVAVLEIPNLDEYHLGQLFYFFMLSTAIFGQALNINPYDQPGVEENKRTILELVQKLNI